jgi:uncharacterized protein
MNCTYCYLPNRTVKGNMQIDVMRGICTNLLNSEFVGSEVELCLHGGEPLAAGYDWFETFLQVVDELSADDLYVKFNIQTNGTLISQEWVDIFKRANVAVGLSIDGPKEIHDRNRRNWNGQSTFERTMKGVELLRSASIQFTVLCVLDYQALGQAGEIFEFMTKLGPSEVAFNLEEKEAAHTTSSLMRRDAKARSREFFRAYWNCAERGGFPHEVREFRHIGNVMGGILNGYELLNHMTEPLCCVTVASNGDFSTFAPELLEPGQEVKRFQNVVIGNVLNNMIGEVVLTPRFQELYEQVADGVKLCKQTCFYFPFCGGGSPSNKFYELGTYIAAETAYCRNAIQAVVDEAIDRVFPGNPVRNDAYG